MFTCNEVKNNKEKKNTSVSETDDNNSGIGWYRFDVETSNLHSKMFKLRTFF